MFSGLIFLILGLLSVGGAISLVVRNMQSGKWAATRGDILRSDYESFEDVDSDSYASIAWRAHLNYRYTVNGREYYGTRVGIAESDACSEKSCKGQTDRYPVGSHPLVFFDPTKPERCCLDRHVSVGSVIGLVVLLIAGVVLAMIGIAMILP